jgi:hypothetical protein
MLLIGRKHIKRTWRDFLIDALGQLDVAVVPISCKQSGFRRAYKLGRSVWQKRRQRKWSESGPRVQTWERESAYNKKEIALLEQEAYASRLFSLHPGIEEEYISLVKQFSSEVGHS